jgi:hypothetical protein
MEGAGATRDNAGAFFGDSWFMGVNLAKAVEVEFPNWSITGAVKNNSASYPKAFLNSYCGSRSGRVRPAGFNAWMVATLPNGGKMLAIGHNTEEGNTKLLLTTAGDGSLGKDYQQAWRSTSGRASKGVDRPMQFVEYYSANGVIDAMNSQHNHYLRLYDSWPSLHFWRKMFTMHEGIVFTEMYLYLRETGNLESFAGSGKPESLHQFLRRFLKTCLHPLAGDHTSVQSPPTKVSTTGAPLARPTCRGPKRNMETDGGHIHGNQTNLRKGKGGLAAPCPVRKACMVCKSLDKRLPNGSFPMTHCYCEYCDGFVHGRGAGKRYDGCWEYHICNKFTGLRKSGEL